MAHIISREEARNFMVVYHNLDGSQELVGEAGVLDLIHRIGCIQYDPLNVVGRNADLVLQSRIKNYSPKTLEHLLYTERSLIDGWDKMMAIYSTNDFPYFNRVRTTQKNELTQVLQHRGMSDAINLVEEVRAIIKENGPIQSNQISIGESRPSNWGHKKLSSATLDYMYTIGELGIYSKKNTQKIYDLIERLLPEHLLSTNDPFINDHEFYKWYIKRRIGSVGMLWNKNGSGWLGAFISSKSLRNDIIDELLQEESIIEIQVEDIKEPFYIRKEDQVFMKQKPIPNVGQILAPLDNMLWDRALIEKLFDYTYSWEVYVPEVKRKYGYYVLPVLVGNLLVARFEPHIHRNNEPLRIKNWWWEEGIVITDEMKVSIEEAFIRFSKFLNVSHIDLHELQQFLY